MGVGQGPAHRRWINLFLVGFLAVLAIDAFHAVGGVHEALKDAVDEPLDVTGLWQGPWRLYGPDVDKDNLRVRAEVKFADGATASWTSPDWSRVSALRKFALARHMNYFANVLHAGKEPAWDGLCAYLARTLRHPGGAEVAVAEVTLFLRGALIPPPSVTVLPAGPYLSFDAWQPIWVWRPAP